MKIDILWSFTEAVDKIRTLKQEYYDVLASFSIYEVKEETNYKHDVRKKIYSLKFAEWQKDKLWEFMNGDVPYSMLRALGNRQRQ